MLRQIGKFNLILLNSELLLYIFFIYLNNITVFEYVYDSGTIYILINANIFIRFG